MQTIYLDISSKGVIPCVQAKQSEVGRKFLAVITDNGVPYNIPENSLLSVWYEGDTDAGNYSSIDEKSAFSVDGNKVTVELVAQMLLREGNGELCLSITHGDGGETNTWNIPYCVEYKPGAGSSVPTEYYTALTEAGAMAAEYANQAKQSAQLISYLFVESEQHKGCYYRMVGDEIEWVNPPMIENEKYRTTERFNGKPVYAKFLNCGALPNATTKSVFVSSNIVDIVRVDGYLKNTAGYTSKVPIHTTKAVDVSLSGDSYLIFTTTSDQSTWDAYVVVYYTLAV